MSVKIMEIKKNRNKKKKKKKVVSNVTKYGMVEI